METKHIHISDYQYELPDERIAKFPIAQRDHSKLLIYNQGKVGEDVFYNLYEYLPQGALMIFNNTKVIQARMHFKKDTGALIEVFLMEPAMPADYEQIFQSKRHCAWYCMIGNLKKWKSGSLTRVYHINQKSVTLKVTRREQPTDEHQPAQGLHATPSTHHWIDFDWDTEDVSFAEILESIGELPIPPYLNRETQESDKTTYQLSLIHISEPTRLRQLSRMPSSA